MATYFWWFCVVLSIVEQCNSETRLDWCHCDISKADRVTTDDVQITRVLINHVNFTGEHRMTCATARKVNYVLECNLDDGNDFASGSKDIILILLSFACFFLLCTSIYLYSKKRKAQEYYETKIKNMNT